MSLSYSEFVPVIDGTGEALSEILEDNDIFHYTISYYLDDAAVSASWCEENKINEISVYHIGSRNQVVLEGYSVKDNGIVQGASTHFGETHVSVLEPNLRMQYGLLEGLDETDYEQKNWL